MPQEQDALATPRGITLQNFIASALFDRTYDEGMAPLFINKITGSKDCRSYKPPSSTGLRIRLAVSLDASGLVSF